LLTFAVEIPSTNLKVKEVKKVINRIIIYQMLILVVSAGRGLKGPENWGMIEELAKELGAATACSRPVADIALASTPRTRWTNRCCYTSKLIHCNWYFWSNPTFSWC
jgi:electron transfer flavoprotein alpha subunit